MAVGQSLSVLAGSPPLIWSPALDRGNLSNRTGSSPLGLRGMSARRDTTAASEVMAYRGNVTNRTGSSPLGLRGHVGRRYGSGVGGHGIR